MLSVFPGHASSFESIGERCNDSSTHYQRHMQPPQTNKQEYGSSPQGCEELDYLDIHTQPGDMRYNQEANPPSLALEPTNSSPLLTLFQPSNLGPAAGYSQDNSTFYQPAAQVFPGINVRGRFNSESHTSVPGMTQPHSQPHRPTTLPHPTTQISTRDQYAAATPSFRRSSEHPIRSPPFAGTTLRHNPMSTTSSPLTGYTTPASRTDGHSYGSRAIQNSVPPLMPTQPLGILKYMDGAATDAKVDISGAVDKGFFISSEGEWTCYRRNYLACACSFSLMPHYVGVPIQFTPSGSTKPFHIYGFAMCISAVVADNEQHCIDLVQHTPKRDKGPTSKPEKIPMRPKPANSSHHSLGMYSDVSVTNGTSGLYTDGFGGSGRTNGQHLATEHTFERIQFKQATQNNGKRRAAQQYYHLTIELWANVGGQTSEPHYVKVAIRKSAKMIVRGRSPGHYQNERRGSQGNGPGGSGSGLGPYSGIGGVGEFGPNAMLPGVPSTYNGTYDSRGSMFSNARQHETTSSLLQTGDEDKVGDQTRGYHFYPGTSYDGQVERVDIFNPRFSSEESISTALVSDGKVKSEYEAGMLPRPFNMPPLRSSGSSTFGGVLDDKHDVRSYYQSPSELSMTIA